MKKFVSVLLIIAIIMIVGGAIFVTVYYPILADQMPDGYDFNGYAGDRTEIALSFLYIPSLIITIISIMGIISWIIRLHEK